MRLHVSRTAYGAGPPDPDRTPRYLNPSQLATEDLHTEQRQVSASS